MADLNDMTQAAVTELSRKLPGKGYMLIAFDATQPPSKNISFASNIPRAQLEMILRNVLDDLSLRSVVAVPGIDFQISMGRR